jgi:hypothetical protein
LMISSILATDMGVHSQFMEEMAKMRLDYCARRGGGKGYQPEHPESARALLCALLIKCADIGNVVCAPPLSLELTRPFNGCSANSNHLLMTGSTLVRSGAVGQRPATRVRPSRRYGKGDRDGDSALRRTTRPRRSG